MIGDLNGKENCSDLQSRAPLVLENVKTDSAKLVNVGVVDASGEGELGRFERVVCGEIDIEEEHSTLEWRVGGT